MKTPFLGIGLSLSLGIVAQRYGFALMSGGPAILLFGAVLLWIIRKNRLFLPFFLAFILLAGAFRAHSAGIRPVNAAENFISPYRVELTGKVLNLPDVKKRGKRVIASFLLEARTLRSGPKRYKKIKTVTGKVQVFWIQPGFIPEKGDTLLVSARLERPRRALNPGEFDHAEYLKQKSVFAVFQPVGYRSGRLIRKALPWDPGLWIGRARSWLAELIDRLYPAPRSAVLKALVLGLRSDVGPAAQNAFMKTGTVHLFATANTKRNFAPFSNKIISAYSP